MMFEVRQPGGEFLRQKIVVEAGTDQIGCNRRRERRWIQMG